MSDGPDSSPMARKKVIYSIAGMAAVPVRRDEEYQATEAGALTMDIYYPPDSADTASLPAVVFVAGYPDPGFRKMIGCPFKEMGSSVSWAQLTAASGMAAITYTNREPAADIRSLLQHVRRNAASLRIDPDGIGLWASSGNVPLALSVLIEAASAPLQCAVLCYGYTLDEDEATGVAAASRTFGFVNPAAGRSVDDLPRDVPLLVVRAGRDETPHLNETLDRFLLKALVRNLPVSFVNHPAAPHAFDLLDDSAASRAVVRQILGFMRFHLTAPTPTPSSPRDCP